MTEYTLEVPDMACQRCESMLQEAVTSLQGITTVEADHTTNELIARGDPEMEGRMRQAITEKGFTLAE